MKIVFIGAGNLATHLSAALRAGGHDIVQIYSRTMASASALAARVGAEPTDSIDSVCRDADVYIFAVKDDVLPQLATQLGRKCGDAVMLHTAGSVSMDVFRDVAHRYGVLYPMQSFSKTRHLELRDVPVYIEANRDEALAVARTLANSVSVKVRELSGEARRRLHLAAVFACNFVNCCYDLASDAAVAAGVPFTDFLPLIDETAAKVHDMSPLAAQTGPAVRYDENVIHKQLAQLKEDQTKKAIYTLMSQSIHQHSKS